MLSTKTAVGLVDAVVVAILVNRDAAVRVERAAAVGVLHVTAQLEHEHAAVAVEGNLRWLLDVGLGRAPSSILKPGGSQNFLALSAGRQRKHGRLRREVWFVGGHAPRPGAARAPGAPAAAAATGTRPPGGARPARCLRRHRQAWQAMRRRRGEPRTCEDESDAAHMRAETSWSDRPTSETCFGGRGDRCKRRASNDAARSRPGAAWNGLRPSAA